MTILDFFVGRWQLGTRFSGHFPCTEVAIVEKFKLESMYGLPASTKKVAVIERWPLVEILLCALDSLSVFSLAKSLQINTTYRLLSQLSASRLLTIL